MTNTMTAFMQEMRNQQGSNAQGSQGSLYGSGGAGGANSRKRPRVNSNRPMDKPQGGVLGQIWISTGQAEATIARLVMTPLTGICIMPQVPKLGNDGYVYVITVGVIVHTLGSTVKESADQALVATKTPGRYSP